MNDTDRTWNEVNCCRGTSSIFSQDQWTGCIGHRIRSHLARWTHQCLKNPQLKAYRQSASSERHLLRRASYKFARMLYCGQLAAALLGASGGASAEQFIVKNVILQQSSGSEIPAGKRSFGNPFDLRCHGTICTGRVQLILEREPYDYDGVATISIETPSIQISIHLHNPDVGRTNRCQPDLTAIYASLSQGKRPGVTVPAMQYGNFNSPASSDPDRAEMVYQVRKDPVAYLDVSVELQ